MTVNSPDQSSRSLRILHSESSKGWGGQEIRTLKEMVALRSYGHSVQLVCEKNSVLRERAEALGFTIFTASMQSAANVASIVGIKNILRDRRIDVLNTHSGHDTLLAGTAARLAATPLIVRTRHLALPITSLSTYTRIPHHVIAVSDFVRQQLIKEGVPRNRVFTIYDGIARPRCQLGPTTLRLELGLKPDDIIGCMVAFMRDKKGHKDLIEAAVPLFQEHQNLHIVMVGDGPLYPEISQLVSARRLEKRIHLLGFRSDVEHILGSCDFFVLPTHQEALGQAFIEAMAVGLPVIGTRVDGVPELIRDQQDGLLVGACDPCELRKAMKMLIENPHLRRRLGNAAKQVLDRGFTVADMAYETSRFYRSCLRQNGVEHV